MSHVDDGELTAYADGAYPANDPVALRIAAHLSTCGNCRTRLEQSHELRDRAAEILAFATPATVAAPSFETLAAQAATPTRAQRRVFPLAWAASIVLALGLGWFSRDMLRPTPRVAERAVQDDAAASRAEVSEAETRGETAAAAPADVPVAAEQSARVQNRVRDLAANRVREGAATGAAAPAPTPASPAAAPPPPAPQAAVSEFAQRLELAQVAITGVPTDYITAAEAERRGLEVPRIPELPVARVGLQGSTTIVEQVLPDETVITLTVKEAEGGERRAVERPARRREEGAKIAASAAPTAPAAALDVAQKAEPVVVTVRGKSVTVSGNVQIDSLRALGRKVR